LQPKKDNLNTIYVTKRLTIAIHDTAKTGVEPAYSRLIGTPALSDAEPFRSTLGGKPISNGEGKPLDHVAERLIRCGSFSVRAELPPAAPRCP